MSQTFITAGDASAGLVSTGGNDGTLVLQTGPAGSKVNAISLAADGTLTLIKQPVVPTQSMVRLDTANGYGSSSTAVRRFTNVTATQGSDITYADSATLGGTFTINVAGVYAIVYTENFATANSEYGISLNAPTLTVSVSSLAALNRLAFAQAYAVNASVSVSWTGYLAAGSVIRAQTGSNGSGVAGNAQFSISRVA